MSIYGIRKAIQSIEKELQELDYSLSKEDMRKHGSNVFILTENIVKELVYIYSYLLYGNNYKNKLAQYKNTTKLMFGNALFILKNLSSNVRDNKHQILEQLDREYLIFDIEDEVFENLLKCSKIRAKIFHEHGTNIQDLDEYKNEIKEGIMLSYKSLNKLKEDNIFPNIVEVDSIVSDRDGNLIYLIDEINSKIPIKLDISRIEEIKNKQWYIFKSSCTQFLIPVINKIDILSTDTKEPVLIDIVLPEDKRSIDLGYLEVEEENKKIYIENKKFFIGRLITNDIQFTNRSISRRHCVIEVIDKKIYIIDLGSKFGTYVNGIKLVPGERNALKVNDEIIIGKGIEQVKINYKMGEK